jgi:hypothetical protein
MADRVVALVEHPAPDVVPKGRRVHRAQGNLQL